MAVIDEQPIADELVTDVKDLVRFARRFGAKDAAAIAEARQLITEATAQPPLASPR